MADSITTSLLAATLSMLKLLLRSVLDNRLHAHPHRSKQGSADQTQGHDHRQWMLQGGGGGAGGVGAIEKEGGRRAGAIGGEAGKVLLGRGEITSNVFGWVDTVPLFLKESTPPTLHTIYNGRELQNDTRVPITPLCVTNN